MWKTHRLGTHCLPKSGNPGCHVTRDILRLHLAWPKKGEKLIPGDGCGHQRGESASQRRPAEGIHGCQALDPWYSRPGWGTSHVRLPRRESAGHMSHKARPPGKSLSCRSASAQGRAGGASLQGTWPHSHASYSSIFTPHILQGACREPICVLP